MTNWKLKEWKKKKKAPTNFNLMSRKFFQEAGWEVILVQHYDARTERSKDMLGVGDLLIYVPESPNSILVQVCGEGDRNKRINKIISSIDAYKWIVGQNGRLIWVHTWQEVADGWDNRLYVITEKDFICRGLYRQDVGQQDVRREEQRLDIVRSIAEKDSERSGAKRTRPELRIVGTTARTGKESEPSS